MVLMKTVLGLLLVLSLGANAYLWHELTNAQGAGSHPTTEREDTLAAAANDTSPLVPQDDAVEGPYPVTRVIDGDTVVVRRGSRQESVRLIGIDAPETGMGTRPYECFSLEATLELERLLEHQNVMLVFDDSQGVRDEYSRLLAYMVRPDGTDVGAELLQNGYVYEFTFRTPYARQDAYWALEQEARQNRVNLWNEAVCSDE